ncbi:MAG: 50S ribosomal protein L5 [Balneolaceae bacterium]|jgi:large subunit ribosomal protein L5
MAEARLYTQYKDEIISNLREQFDYDNIMAVPKLEKIVINSGVGEAVENEKILETVSDNLARITGQHPINTKARKSISNFKVREGMPIGCKVTLRKKRMYEFLDRLINLALPRTRDFQGVPDKSFDGRGNYTLGVKEHTIFPEINTDEVDKVHGLDITFVTTAETDEEAFALLKEFGMPFQKRN